MTIRIPEQSVDALLTSKSDAPLSREFTAVKQAELFETLRHLRFSGQLVLITLKGRKSILHLYKGMMIYVTGGEHANRRWFRSVRACVPELIDDLPKLEREIIEAATHQTQIGWQYQLLASWVKRQAMTLEQAARIIWGILNEAWFDITQAVDLTYELQPISTDSTKHLVFIEPAEVIVETERLWDAWQMAKLAKFSPNSAPTIQHSQELQNSISTAAYQMLSQLVDGEQTLRDLAVSMKRDMVSVLGFLLPYIQSGLLDLTTIRDRPGPMFAPAAELPNIHSPLIACVDDSPWICQILEGVLTGASYRFVGVNDPVRAIGILLASKPNLIFLDLIMPNTNGYELCSKLRQIEVFRHTPIVILTGNDGIVDRVRAKLVGASDFLSKPVDPQKVLSVIHKHLKNDAPTLIPSGAALPQSSTTVSADRKVYYPTGDFKNSERFA